MDLGVVSERGLDLICWHAVQRGGIQCQCLVKLDAVLLSMIRSRVAFSGPRLALAMVPLMVNSAGPALLGGLAACALATGRAPSRATWAKKSRFAIGDSDKIGSLLGLIGLWVLASWPMLDPVRLSEILCVRHTMGDAA